MTQTAPCNTQHEALATGMRPAFVLCSFAITEHYVIMAHWPSTIKPLKLVSSARLMKALAWEPANGVRFRIFDRKRGGRGLVATFRQAPFTIVPTAGGINCVGSRTTCAAAKHCAPMPSTEPSSISAKSLDEACAA